MKVRIGDVTFDGERRQLLRGRDPVPLSPKALQLLELLLARRPSAVPKGEIQDSLWPDVFVSEGNLPPLVSELRHALREDAHSPRFIRTVHGFGYAFEPEVPARETLPGPHTGHRLVWGGKEHHLKEGENVVGRDPEGICVDHSTVSRRHARIVVVAGGQATLEDLGSKNGTWRRKEWVDRVVPLVDGDEVKVGTVILVYRAPGSDLDEETQTAV